jgi:hypothetical protein
MCGSLFENEEAKAEPEPDADEASAQELTTTPALFRYSSRRNDHPRRKESSGKSRLSEKRRKLKVTVQDQD